MHSAKGLSKYLVTRCIEDGHPITNLELQNLLYLIQKEFLANEKLAFANDFEAWPMGPIVPEVFYHFCEFGSMPITTIFPETYFEPAEKALIDDVLASKRHLTPFEFEREIRPLIGPWSEVYRGGDGYHEVIPKSLIRNWVQVKSKASLADKIKDAMSRVVGPNHQQNAKEHPFQNER